jgi:2-iminobutanoate/2-iminopropanoate deaminase
MPYEFVECSSSPPPITPISQAVVARGTRHVVISGQVAFNEKGELVGAGDAEAQAVQALTNMKVLVEAAGGTMTDIARIAFFVLDRSHFAGVIAARKRFFSAPFPASTGVIISGLLHPELLVEIEGTAYLD